MLKKALSKNYDLLREASLNALHLSVWVKKSISDEFFQMEIKHSFLGALGLMPNKAFITL